MSETSSVEIQPGSGKLPEESAHALKDLQRIRKPFRRYREMIRELKMAEEEINFLKMSDGKLRSNRSEKTYRLDTEVFKHELNTPLDIPVNDDSETQTIRMLLLNSEDLLNPEDGVRKPVTIFFPGITGEVDKKLVKLQAEQLALEIDGPVVVFDIPPFGGSGAFTAKQKEQLKNAEGFSEIAQAHLHALKMLIEVVQVQGVELNLTGYSLGAYIAAEAAAIANRYDLKVRNVLSLETAGVEEMGSKELGEAFISQGPLNDALVSIPHDIKICKGQDLAYTKPGTKVRQAYWALSNVRDAIRMSGSLGRALVPDRLSESLRNQHDAEVLVVSGTNSSICTPQAVDAMFTGFDTNLDPGARRRAHRQIIQGAPHPIFQNPQRLAKEVREGLEYMEQARAVRHASGPRSDTV